MKIVIGTLAFSPLRIFCIGRNYVAHVKELHHPIPKKPVVFMKPVTSLVPPQVKIPLPKHGKELHYEAEVVVCIGREGQARTEEESRRLIAGISIGLDLTLRDLQNDIKKEGLPWEVAKSFEQSAPVGDFLPYDPSMDLKNISFSCSVNEVLKQRGNTKDMIFPIERLIIELSQIWLLRPGDLVYTGTPQGVGPLKVGDRITLESEQIGLFSWEII